MPAQPMPAAVLLACWLLGGVAATRVIVAIGTFYAIPELRWHFAAQPTSDLPLPTGTSLAVLFGIVSLLVGAVYLTLAILSGRSYVARIVTWVVCGLTVCACTPGLVSGTDDVPWYARLVLTMNGVMLALAIAAAILLALPAAHRHYRSRRPPRPPMPRPVPRYGYPYQIPYGPPQGPPPGSPPGPPPGPPPRAR